MGREGRKRKHPGNSSKSENNTKNKNKNYQNPVLELFVYIKIYV